jgi:hypothetical protein
MGHCLSKDITRGSNRATTATMAQSRGVSNTGANIQQKVLRGACRYNVGMLLRFTLAVVALLVTAWLTGIALRRLRRRF